MIGTEKRFSDLVIAAACVSLLVAGARVARSQDTGAGMRDLERRVAELEKKLEKESAYEVGLSPHPHIRSSDGKFDINFGGRLQARYTYQGRDVNRNDRDGSDRSWAELERARVRTEGHLFDPRFFFRLEWDGDSDKGRLGLTDAYLQYVHKDKEHGFEAKLGAGQWKPFFGRQEKQSSAQQLLVDRSLANEFFNIDRNIGVWIEGRKTLGGEDDLFSTARFEFGVSDGFDSANQSLGDGEFDQIPAFIAHVETDVFGNLGKKYALSGGDYKRRKKPGLTVGASFASDSNNGTAGVDSDFVEFDVYQMAFDFVYKYMGFSLNGEYFGRWLDFQASDVTNGEQGGVGEAIYTHGGYIEAGYMLTEKLQVVGRTSAVWASEGPVDGNAVEAGGGVNYFLNEHHLKLSLDVLFFDISPDLPTPSEKLPGHDRDLSGSGGSVFSNASLSSSSANIEEFQGVMVRAQAQVYF